MADSRGRLSISQDYECPICRGILHEPQQIATCGHRYCKKCLDPILRTNPSLCPLDRKKIEVDQVFPDIGHKRTIQGLQVNCLNSFQGCEWTGDLLDMQHHRNNCPFEKIKCSNDNCEEMIERREEEKHSKEDCVWRMKTCQYCTEDYVLCLENDHMKSCQCLPIPCPNKCKAVIPRKKIIEHVKAQCPLTTIDCPYSATGCEIKIKRAELQKHINHSVQSHLDIALKRVQEWSQENKRLKRKYDEMEERLNDQEKQLKRFKDKSDDSQEIKLPKIIGLINKRLNNVLEHQPSKVSGN